MKDQGTSNQSGPAQSTPAPTHDSAPGPSVSATDPAAAAPSRERVDHSIVDWYYHDPGEGRVGPYSAEDMRKRYRDRRIQRDTLVWRHGLREWQPLDRVSDEVGIDDVVPDASRPPPLMPGSAVSVSHAAGTPMPAAAPAARSKYARQPLKAKRTLPTWAIVLIVLLVVSIPACGILGSIMLPAYQEYAERANTGAALTGAGIALTRNVAEYHALRGTCPTMDDPQVAQVARRLSERMAARGRFGRLAGGTCMFELTVRHDDVEADGKTLRYVGWKEGGDFVWDCSEGSLPNAYRPLQCQTDEGI
jgi:type IV pilus assembly protein PilA